MRSRLVMCCRPLGIALLTSMFATTGYARLDDGIDPPPVGFRCAAGAGYNGWFTSDDDDAKESVGHAVDYDMKMLPVWQGSVVLEVRGRPLFGLTAQRSINEYRDLGAVLIPAADVEPAMQGIQGYVDFYTIARFSANPLVRILSGLRLDGHFGRFGLSGEAVESTAILEASGRITPLAEGSSFAYNAFFRDWYLGLIRLGDGDATDIRLGIFRSELEKPHEAAAPHLFDEDVHSLVAESLISGSGGFVSGTFGEFHALARIGTVNIKAQADVGESDVYADEGGIAGLISMQWNPRITVAHAVFISPSFGGMFRFDLLKSRALEFDANESDLSMDVRVHAAVSLGVEF